MRLMVRVKTPKGIAADTEKKLRPFIVGVKKINHEILINKNDDAFLWIIQSGHKDYMRIVRNVAKYDKLLHMILDRRDIRKLARLTKEQEKELDDVLNNGTKIEMIPRMDQEKIKKKFKVVSQS